MIKKILKSRWSLGIMLAAMLVLIWNRTFIGMANGCETTILEIPGHCALTMVLTLLWGCGLFLWDDENRFFYKDDEGADAQENFLKRLPECEDYQRKPSDGLGLRNSLCVVLVLTVICLLSFALSDWNNWLDLFSDSIYIWIGWFGINKRYIFDVLTELVFPIWSVFIIRKIKENGFTGGAVFSGIMQIVALTLIGFLLYMRMPNIWLTEMAVLNVITLILAVRGYAWRDLRRKGNAIAFLILYALFWGVLLSVFHYRGQSFAGFMGFTDSTEVTDYFSNIHKIAVNASLLGQNSTLLTDYSVISFLKDSCYLIPSVLFYGGWIPAILLIFVEVIFIAAMAGVLMQVREHDGRDIMLDMIWVGFFIRLTAGLLYSFGLMIPIFLPFSGTAGIITDSICMGMLLLAYLCRKLNLWSWLSRYDFEDWEDDGYEEDDEQS